MKKHIGLRITLLALAISPMAQAQQSKDTYTLESKFVQMPTNGVIEISSDAASAQAGSFTFGPNVHVRQGGKTVIRTEGAKLEIDSAAPGLDLLAAPRVSAFLGQEAVIRIQAPPPSFFVPTDEGTYRLVKMDEGPGTSLKCIVAAAQGEPDKVRLNLEYHLVEMSGRKPLPNVELPVGEPILNKRQFKTDLVTVVGQWMCLAGAPGQGPQSPPNDLIVLIRLTRGEPTKAQ